MTTTTNQHATETTIMTNSTAQRMTDDDRQALTAVLDDVIAVWSDHLEVRIRQGVLSLDCDACEEGCWFLGEARQFQEDHKDCEIRD